MHIVVTGGAGFIGSRLVGALLHSGNRVTVIDDLSSSSPSGVSHGADLIRLDVSADEAAGQLRELRPDAVVHAAAQVSVPKSVEDPLRDLNVNVRGTLAMLQGARAAGVQRFVFISSGGAVYGDVAPDRPAREEDLPAPLSPYGIHKLAAEHHVARSGLSFGVARLANVYGPGQRSDLEGGVVAIFAERIGNGLGLEIHGTGDQSRDFVHVDDVVAALDSMLHSERTGIWNVGTGRATTIVELADMVAGSSEARDKITRKPRRDGDVLASVLDVSKIERELGWRPRIDLADGLRSIGPQVDPPGSTGG